MPSMRFSRTSSAIFSISRALFTWYGISLTMIAWRSPPRLVVSMPARARIWMMPRPVS